MEGKTIRVAMLVNRVNRTGPVIVFQNIVKSAREQGLNIEFVAVELRSPLESDADFRQEIEALDCSCYSMGYGLSTMEFATCRVAKRLGKLLRSLRVDVLHCHGYHPTLIGSHMQDSFAVLTTQHNIAFEDFSYDKGEWMGRYMYYRLKLALSRHRHLVGITNFVTDYYRSFVPKCVQLSTIYNGVDQSLFKPPTVEEKQSLRAELNIAVNAFLMIMVGGLNARKDPLTVLNAVELLYLKRLLPSNFKLLLLGEGELEGKCRPLIDRLDGYVELVGFKTDIDKYMKAADALVSASHSEGFGLNVVEALSVGLDVPSTIIPVFNELRDLTESADELVFKPSDSVALASVILRMVEGKISTKFDRSALYLLSAEKMALDYYEYYQKLLTL